MYARVGLRGSRRFGLVLTGTSLCLATQHVRRYAANSKCKHSTEKPNMQARTFEDSVMERPVMETQAI